MFRSYLPLLLLTVSPAFAFGGSPSDKSTSSIAPESASFADSGSLSEYFFGKNNFWDSAYDAVEQWKKDYHLPITIGANNWWHLDRGKRLYGNGYGVPGEAGTYYYSLDFDPSLKLDEGGFLSEIGLHTQARFRDGDDKLRGFYRSTIWTYEAYAYAETKIGTFKGGQIVQQFGVPWDYSWWEGLSYFDGYKFNPAYGFSWEDAAKVSDRLRVDMALQYFMTDDRVSGAIAGADAESSPPLRERNTGVVRIVPRWKFTDDLTLSLGGSGLARQIKGGEGIGADNQLAWGTDVTLTWKKLSIFGEYIDSHGVISPARYVSGGPSDRQNSFSSGINYQWGPISAHVNYSVGWDHHPYGHQYEFNPGITFQLTKNVTFYTEYVKWNVTNSQGVTSRYDDGVELILVWKY